MARPRSTLCTITFEAGRPKPYRCRWRTSAGEKKARSYATEAEALAFKADYDGEQAIIPADPVPVPRPPKLQREAAKTTGGLGLMVTAPKGSLTLSQVGTEWLANFVGRKKPATQVSYEQNWRLHIEPVIGQVKVKQGVLGTPVVLGLIDNRAQAGVRWPTQRVILRVLSSLLGWAVLYEHLLVNPCTELVRKLRDDSTGDYEEPEPNPLTREQCDAFLTWVLTGRVVGQPDRPADGPRHGSRWGARLLRAGWEELYPVFLVLARTGMRRGEMAALKWTDLFLDRRPRPQAELTRNASPAEKRLNRLKGKEGSGETTLKTRKGRVVDLSPELVQVLRELLKQRRAQALKDGRPMSPYVCLGLQGRPLGAHSSIIDGVFEAGMKALGLERAGHTIHDLRDTFATCHLMLNPGKLGWVSKMLGHKDKTTTLRRYTKWVPTDEQAKDWAADLDLPSRGIIAHQKTP